MTDAHILFVELREKSGKQVAKALRNQMLLPAVLYGKTLKGSVPISCSATQITRILSKSGHNVLFKFDSNDERLREATCVIKSMQTDPIRRTIKHIDFLAVSMTEEIEATVALHFVGIPIGVSQQGGVLEPVRREIVIKCLPGAVPEFIEVDVSGLGIGGLLHISDLKLSSEIKPASEENFTVVRIAAPSKVEAPVKEEVAVAPEEVGEATEEKTEEAPKK